MPTTRDPEKARLDVQLPQDLKADLDALAKRVGTSTNAVLVLLAALATGYEPKLADACVLLAGGRLATKRRRPRAGSGP